MQIISWLNEFNITIIKLKDTEIMLGYTNESPHWTFLITYLLLAKSLGERDDPSDLASGGSAGWNSAYTISAYTILYY